MIHSAAERLTYIKNVINTKSPVRKIKLFYKGATRELDVYELDLDYLVYNQYNDRIAMEMRTRAERMGVGFSEEYTKDLQDKIEDYLWKENEERNKHTLKNIHDIGQQKPGVVTLDGVIIDGNRRAMLLKKDKKSIFEAAIIPQTSNDDKKYIRELETQIQFGTDEKVDYEPINKYLKLKNFCDEYDVDKAKPYTEKSNKEKIANIAELFDEKVSKIIEYLEIMDLMDEYLEFIDAKGIYVALKKSKGTHEGAFWDLRAQLKSFQKGAGNSIAWVYDETVIDDYKRAYFLLIRSEIADPKDYRKLAPSAKKGAGVLSKKETFDNFINNVDKAVSKTPNESLDEYIQRNNFDENTTIDDIAKKREAEWRSAVASENKDGLHSALRKTIREIEDERDERAPSEYLRDAFVMLSKITQAHLDSPEFINDQNNLELAKDINKLSWNIKKAME